MTSRSTVASSSIPLWLLILLVVAWIPPGLVGHDPWKPDEAYSFGIVYHILQTGNWIVPTLAGEPFMEKPPLFYVTAALFAQALSPWLPLHDGAHLAAGFYVALTLFFIYRTARVLHGHGATAVLALLACLGLAPLGHLLITDLALLAGFSISLYGFALAPVRKGWGGALLGTGAGMAFLSKGLLGPGVIGLLALALPLLSRAWRTRTYAQFLVIAAAAALPWLLVWPAALYAHSPYLFKVWLWDNNFGRFLGSSGLGPKQDVFFYLRTLPWFAWPAWPLAFWGLWVARHVGFRRADILLPLLAFVLAFAVLTLAAEARQIYMLPLLLPLALLAAPALERLPRNIDNLFYGLGVIVCLAVAVLVWIAWSVLAFGVPAALLPAFDPVVRDNAINTTTVALALLYTIGAGAALYAGRRLHERSLLAWAIATTLGLGLSMTLLLDWLDARKSYRELVVSLQQALPNNYRCIISEGLGEPQRAMLDYHAGIRTHRTPALPAANCDLYLSQENTDEPRLLNERDWELLWQQSRPGDGQERYRLYRRR